MFRRLPLAVVLVALVTLMAAPGGCAREGGSDLPFQATLAGEVYWEIPSASRPDCGPIATFTEATGEADYMEEITAAWSHCPATPEIENDGRLTLVAADGDELYGTYNYPEDSDVIPITITGGTGRFEDASGSVEAVSSPEQQFTPECTTEPFCFGVGEGGTFLDFTVRWPWSATLTGTITY
jgi:hypothetical protein